ncbi:TolC family protein [candidate division FCPU426 bacterium]|nr:TolC family protein [candidate division FCPU426 bacterium]
MRDNIRSTLCAALLLLGLPTAAPAGPLTMTLPLVQAEARAQTCSARIASKLQEAKSTQSAADGQYSLFWPKLSLEGSYTYLSELSAFDLPAGPGRTQTITLGDHHNYSIGLQAAWNAWDSFAVYNSWQALQALARAKQEELRVLQRETVLKVRLAYFQAQLAAERLRLINQSARLAQAQYRDIQAKARAGAASRMDLLASHVEALGRERQLQSAQTDLALALRDLNRLTGQTHIDASKPWYTQAEDKPLAGFEQPSLYLELDPLEESLARFETQAGQPTAADHPQAAVFMALAESAQASAFAISAGHWPRLSVAVKTSLDYPDGPVQEQYNQNMLSIKASWPLWEGNRVVNQEKEKTLAARAQEQQAAYTREELALAWNKARDRLSELQAGQPLLDKIEKETAELAAVAYSAFRAGRADYLDVQAANLKALESGTQAALNKVQRLIQLAMLESLSAEKE